VSGEDIKPTTIEVTLKVYENIWELLQVTFLGALVSGISGFLLTHLEKKEEFERSIDDDSSIISHINGHIREINKNRSHIKEEYWKYLDDTLPIKKEAIERYRDQLALDPKAEAVEWFEKATQLLSEKYLDEGHTEKRTLFSEIKKPNEQSKFYLGLIKKLKEINNSSKAFTDFEKYLSGEIIEKKLKEYGLDAKKLTELKRSKAIQFLKKENNDLPERIKYDEIKTEKRERKVKEDIWNLKKWVYFASTLLVALPTTMFVTDKFVQNPLLDVIIAFAIGFAIYRAQDIQKTFRAVKKTPKVADKNSISVVKVPPADHDNGGKHNH